MNPVETEAALREVAAKAREEPEARYLPRDATYADEASGELADRSDSSAHNRSDAKDSDARDSDVSPRQVDERSGGSTPRGSPPTSEPGGEEGDGEEEENGSKRGSLNIGDRPPSHRGGLGRRRSSNRGRGGSKGKVVIIRRGSNDVSPTLLQGVSLPKPLSRVKSDERPSVFTSSPAEILLRGKADLPPHPRTPTYTAPSKPPSDIVPGTVLSALVAPRASEVRLTSAFPDTPPITPNLKIQTKRDSVSEITPILSSQQSLILTESGRSRGSERTEQTNSNSDSDAAHRQSTAEINNSESESEVKGSGDDSKHRVKTDDSIKRRLSIDDSIKRRSSIDDVMKRRSSIDDVMKRRSSRDDIIKRRSSIDESSKRRLSMDDSKRRPSVDEPSSRVEIVRSGSHNHVTSTVIHISPVTASLAERAVVKQPTIAKPSSASSSSVAGTSRVPMPRATSGESVSSGGARRSSGPASNVSSPVTSPSCSRVNSGSGMPTVRLAGPIVPFEYFGGSAWDERLRGDDGQFITFRSKFATLADAKMTKIMRTVSAAIVCCLNLGTDPPDIIKPNPCATLEAWVDPRLLPNQKALEEIGNRLQSQYEALSPKKARYIQCLDPSNENLRDTLKMMRSVSGEDRIMFHYNGHGVVCPTATGDFWVFDPTHTLYNPVAVYNLQSWIGSPAVMVLDCSGAGRILKSFIDCANLRDEQARTGKLPKGETVFALQNCVVLAACKANEVLPMNPKFPADIFTACLTTPIKMALRWFIHRNSLTTLTEDLVDQVPGTESDKKSMLGELTSIFTTITDSIAWNVLPNDVFAKLLRQELFVGTLVRNFLLASRIMSSMNCTPVSYPPIPDVHNHSLWDSWDLAVERCLLELVKLSRTKTEALNAVEIVRPVNPPSSNLNFFSENLTAFQMWLELGSYSSPPPMRLPVILQVLLSPLYRMKALMLLARFMQKGPWAVNMALSIGLCPYVLRLLNSAYTAQGGADMREVLIFIWARILGVEISCRQELISSGCLTFFVAHLAAPQPPVSQKVMLCFILAACCHRYPEGQAALFKCTWNPPLDAQAASRPPPQGLMSLFSILMTSPDAQLRKWSCLVLHNLWKGFLPAKNAAFTERIPEKLCKLFFDLDPQVRAASVCAIGSFFAPLPDSLALSGPLPLAASSSFSGPSASSSSSSSSYSSASANVGSSVSLSPKHPAANTSTHQPSSLPPSLPRSVSGVPTSAILAPARSSSNTSSNASSAPPSPIASSSASSSASTPVLPSFATNTSSRTRDIPPPIPEDATALPEDPVLRNSAKMLALGQAVAMLVIDASPQVREEVVLALSELIYVQQVEFGELAYALLESDGDQTPAASRANPQEQRTQIWKVIQALCHDPFPDVSRCATMLKDAVLRSQPALLARFKARRGQQLMSPSASSGGGFFTNPALLSLPPSSSATSNNLLAPPSESNKPSPSLGPANITSPPLTASAPPSPGTAPLPAIRKIPSLQLFPSQTPKKPLDDKKMKRGILTVEIESDEPVGIKPNAVPPSILYSWNAEQYLLPKEREPSDVDLERDLAKEWRRNRNYDQERRARDLVNFDESRDGMFDQVAVLLSGFDHCSQVLFHPYENLLVATDGRQVGMWDHQGLEQINVFANQPLSNRSKVTAMRFLNEQHVSLLLTAADDGHIRVWKDPHLKGKQRIVSAWTAARTVGRDHGILVDWHNGKLISSSSDLVRVWDIQAERCTQELRVPSQVSAMSFCLEGQAIASGFVDGSVRLFDMRDTKSSVQFTKHSHSVVGLQMQSDRLISGGAEGTVSMHDLRGPMLSRFATGQSLEALSAHPFAPLFAAGSSKQVIKVFDSNTGNVIHATKYHKGFMGHRIGAVSCLAFHPNQVLLAAGAQNSFISILAAVHHTS